MLHDEMTSHELAAAAGSQTSTAGRPRTIALAPATAIQGSPAGNDPREGTGGGRSHGGGDAPVSTALSRETTETGGDAREGRAISGTRESAKEKLPGLHPDPADGGETTANRRLPDAAEAKSPRARDDQGRSKLADGGQPIHALIEGEGAKEASVGDDLCATSALPSPLDASPLVAQIVEAWRRRQAFVEARRKLILQGKALARRMAAGDKAAGALIYAAAETGADPVSALVLDPILAAQEPLTREIAKLDREMLKLAKGLPVADWAAAQKGFGLAGLAKTVGELGDLSAYAKGPAGVWKRAGLAVIGGERQRRVAGEAALLHGYSPSRRSTFWNVAAALLKSQGTGEDAGPWRRLYDARKAVESERCETAAHAHNRALRYVTKRLLRDLWREWRRVSAEPRP